MVETACEHCGRFHATDVWSMCSHPIHIRAWDSDFGVPSVDPDSLRIMTMFKMSKVPNVKICASYLPQWRDIPSVEYGGDAFQGDAEITHLLRKMQRGYILDSTLDFASASHMTVYKKYFKDCFITAFLYDVWLNPINYKNCTKIWYCNAMPFPFDRLHLHKMKEFAECYCSSILEDEQSLDRCYKDAYNCIQDLGRLLIDQPYLLGKEPTTLDVLVYSYMAITLYMPLPDSPLKNFLKTQPRLIKYVEDITKEYYPGTKLTYKYVDDPQAGFIPASLKTLIIAGLLTSAAMILYGYYIGTIKMEH